MLTKRTSSIIRTVILTVNRLTLVFVVLLFSLNIAGCKKNKENKMAVQNNSGIKEIYDKLEAPIQDDGRLVIYWEKKPLIAKSGSVKITGDEGFISVGLDARTGAIVDLPSGKYVLSIGGVINKHEITFAIEAGKTVLCNSETLYSFIDGPMDGDLKLVPIEEGLSALEENDIRCCLKSCNVLTLVPNIEKNQRQFLIEKDRKVAELLSKDSKFNSAKSRIYVTRDVNTTENVKAGIDAIPDFSMGGKSFFCFDANPGFHVITVSDPNGERGFKIKTEAGDRYFFNTNTLDYISSDEGMELVAKYELLKEGFFFE